MAAGLHAEWRSLSYWHSSAEEWTDFAGATETTNVYGSDLIRKNAAVRAPRSKVEIRTPRGCVISPLSDYHRINTRRRRQERKRANRGFMPRADSPTAIEFRYVCSLCVKRPSAIHLWWMDFSAPRSTFCFAYFPFFRSFFLIIVINYRAKGTLWRKGIKSERREVAMKRGKCSGGKN